MDTKAYRETCVINRPCNCNATIIYRSHSSYIDSEHVGIKLFEIDKDLNVTCVFESVLEGDDDNLSLECSSCGADWSRFNPLFW